MAIRKATTAIPMTMIFCIRKAKIDKIIPTIASSKTNFLTTKPLLFNC